VDISERCAVGGKIMYFIKEMNIKKCEGFGVLISDYYLER